MITTNYKDKETLIATHAQSGGKILLEEVKLIQALLFKVIVNNFMDDETTHIPYLGEIKINHKEDIVVDGLKEAVLEVVIEPSALLKREIGSIGDDVKESLLVDDLTNKLVLELEAHKNGQYKRKEEKELEEIQKTKKRKTDIK